MSYFKKKRSPEKSKDDNLPSRKADLVGIQENFLRKTKLRFSTSFEDGDTPKIMELKDELREIHGLYLDLVKALKRNETDWRILEKRDDKVIDIFFKG